MAGWIKISLASALAIMFDGDLAPQKRNIAPQFLANVCWGQMDGWIKIPLDREVYVGAGHIVLDGEWDPLVTWHSPQF